MAHGLRVLVLSICIASVIAAKAGAQQVPSNGNPKSEKFQEIMKDMKGLRAQLDPLRSRIQQLMAQLNALKEQMRSIKEKISVDHDQLQAMRGHQ